MSEITKAKVLILSGPFESKDAVKNVSEILLPFVKLSEEKHDKVELIVQTGVRPDQIQGTENLFLALLLTNGKGLLLRHDPEIVHFIGWAESGALGFASHDGSSTKTISTEAFVDIFSGPAARRLRVLVLSCPYSQEFAKYAIAKKISFVLRYAFNEHICIF
jgi:hypothetical protein